MRRTDAPERRGSVARAGVAMALCAGMVSGCGQPRAEAPVDPWFGAYVDVTLTPRYDLRDQDPGPGRTVLSFIVADPRDGCTPSWGGFYGLDSAASELDMDEQIEAVTAGGGQAVISFGGQAGTELATSCQDADALQDAYAAVIERYGVNTVDFDVEADDLDDDAAASRRAEAVAALQRDRPEADPLEVWVTLPVGVRGLEEDSRNVVAQMLEAGVELAGVNVMTMNYSTGKAPGQSVYEASTAAARAAQQQVKELYGRSGNQLSDDQAWRRMGLTPMIGRNDIEGEVLDLEAARRFNRFAVDQGVGRVSLWSLNRDRPCSGKDAQEQGVSNVCSGVRQHGGEFSRTLGADFS